MNPPLPARSSAATPPRISAVVMAYDRREYLSAAIRSLTQQTLARSEFEIIVIKNFSDPDIDTQVQNAGARGVFDASPHVGGTVARALEEAAGEVVCFLDDDDEFEPGKLAEVARQFRDDPELVLYRNAYHAIDREGTPLPHWPICEWPADPVSHRVTLSSPSEKQRSRVLPMFNLSTISVRRTALLPFTERFREVVAGSDSLVFLAALSTPGHVRVDPLVLSRHRVHRSVTMEWAEQDGVVAPTSPTFLLRSLVALGQQRSLVRGTVAEPWAAWVYLITRFDAFLARPEFSPPTLREFVAFARGLARERQPFRLWALGFAGAGWIAPDWARAHWWSFRQHRQVARTPGVDYARLFPAQKERQ